MRLITAEQAYLPRPWKSKNAIDTRGQRMYILGMGLMPYSKHLEWLLIEGQAPEQITAFYDNIQMPVPTASIIAEHKEKVDKLIIPPGIKKMLQKGVFKQEYKAVWERLGYGEIYGKRCGLEPKIWEELGRILAHPVMRISLDALIICKLDEEKLIQILPSQYSLRISEESLKLYKKYFGNYENFLRGDWKSYLNIVKNDSFIFQRVFTALTKSSDEVLHICGLPTQKQYSDFLRNVLATADYKFKHYSRQNDPGADDAARKWAKIGVDSGEKYEKYGASDANDFAKLVQTEFEYVEQEFATIDEATMESIRPALLEGGESDKKGPEKTPPPVIDPYGGV